MKEYDYVFEHKAANRNNKAKYAETIAKILNSHQQIDAIVDFCAYTTHDIECITKTIEGKNYNILQYIFISSHSVYKACTAGREEMQMEF